MVEKSEVAAAFDLLKGFLANGSAMVSGEDVAKMCAALKVVDEWSKGLKRCLDGAQCPAKITMTETPSGLMVDEDTPGQSFIEFKSEYQAP